jgi:large subunit ribosomal protein L21
MKKAVILTGGKQYLVSEGETLEVELIKSDKPKLKFQPLLIIDGDKTTIGQPLLTANEVSVEIVEESVKGEKVLAIRYKAKKRVRKVHGHRQSKTIIKVTQIK